MASLLLLVFTSGSCQRNNTGVLLYEAYFDATPVNGYATQRSLAAAALDEDASILRQGIRYHQERDYDLALMSFRAYLESNPEPGNDQVFLLTATAAMASGNYAEAEAYLKQIDKDNSEFAVAASWHTAMLALRNENLDAAAAELRLLEQAGMDRLYPIKAILADL